MGSGRGSKNILLNMLLVAYLVLQLIQGCYASHCRTLPGDAGFPSPAEWNKLENDVGGRLLAVVPSAKTCHADNCTKDQWSSASYRTSLPGAMVYVSFVSFHSLPLLIPFS